MNHRTEALQEIVEGQSLDLERSKVRKAIAFLVRPTMRRCAWCIRSFSLPNRLPVWWSLPA